MSATANARASSRSADGGSAAAATPQSAAMSGSAAAPSPFTPIANYGFLSNCHTGALVAPDGTVDWLCVPRFDSPSVFGALLDRGAGSFRFGPFGINVPSDRIYEPGTNTLVTSWKTQTGWVVVRDALTMGPRRCEDTVTPHTRPPSDEDANHALVRIAQCIDGRVEIDLVCEPGFDYGRLPGEWTLTPDRHRADAKGGEQALRLQTDMLVGIEAEILPTCRELGIGVTAYGVLSRGLLGGHWSKERETGGGDFRSHAPRFQGENLRRNLDLAEALGEVAANREATTAQVAIAWVLSRGEDIVPLVGARRRDRLEEALGAVAVELSEEDLAAVERAVPAGAAAGERYEAGQMAMLDSER